MAARFVDKREIRSIEDLTEVQLEQLRLAGMAYDGEELPVAARLAEDSDPSEGSFYGFCDLWRVCDGDERLYDAWIYAVDSGSIYRANTTEEVAGIVQFGLECDDSQLRLQLGAAMVEARLLPKSDSSYQEFAAELARQTGG